MTITLNVHSAMHLYCTTPHPQSLHLDNTALLSCSSSAVCGDIAAFVWQSAGHGVGSSLAQSGAAVLTHWDRDKMDAISQTTFSNAFMEWSPIKISLKFVPKGPINNIPALVQIMASMTHTYGTMGRWFNSFGLTFCRRHFQLIFFDENLCILIQISMKYVPDQTEYRHISNISVLRFQNGVAWQDCINGSGDGSAPNRRQTNIYIPMTA